MLSFGKLVTLVSSAVALTMAHNTCQQAHVIGSDSPLDISASATQPFSYVIQKDGATYIAPHFASLNIPSGAVLEIRSLDGSQKVRYDGSRENFYAEYIRGSEAVITYYPPENNWVEVESVAFTLDRFASGFPASDLGNQHESICGKDDTKAAVCLKNTDREKYNKAQAVARLFIGGQFLCTGWLFGSEGHMITNNHCIGDAVAAQDVQIEFGAECSTCADPNNTKQLECPGETVATSVQFIHTNKNLDYSIVKPILKAGVDLKKYGYLQARASGPVLNEPIYIVQHPDGKPTRMATVVDDGSIGTVESMSIKSCKDDEIGYTLDTEGGSSGSPVLSTTDHVVVALHNCGGCMNGAIKIDKVVNELKDLNFLPANAVAGKGPSPSTSPKPTAKPTPKPSTKPKVCGTCTSCYYPAGKSCLRDFTKGDCADYNADYGTIWCGK